MDQLSAEMMRASVSPSSMFRRPMVPQGWRRRSVGDPGLKIRMPSQTWSSGI
jgi:hypothetical protein